MRNTEKLYKRDILNQIINFFWTAFCFTPVFWFWFQEGIDNIYFYSFLGVALLFGQQKYAITKVVAITTVENTNALTFAENLGFRIAGIMENNVLLEKRFMRFFGGLI